MKRSKRFKKAMAIIAVGAISITSLVGCSSGGNEEGQVTFYSNADNEAIAAIESVLNDNGYEGKYLFQSMGTSELGGKLLAEGTDIEADFITMSSYYVDSAQDKNNMFEKLDFPVNSTEKYPEYEAPITSQEGAIFVNSEVLEGEGLEAPKSVKDLADPKYKDLISIADINSSSTGWLIIQTIIDAYGDGPESEKLLTAIYKNAGNHLEASGSGPIKKVRAGEVAVGFGLRQQAMGDKADGLAIEVVDPTEGTYSLIETLAVVDKGKETNPLAMEMAKCIIEKVDLG